MNEPSSQPRFCHIRPTLQGYKMWRFLGYNIRQKDMVPQRNPHPSTQNHIFYKSLLICVFKTRVLRLKTTLLSALSFIYPNYVCVFIKDPHTCKRYLILCFGTILTVSCSKVYSSNVSGQCGNFDCLSLVKGKRFPVFKEKLTQHLNLFFVIFRFRLNISIYISITSLLLSN